MITFQLYDNIFNYETQKIDWQEFFLLCSLEDLDFTTEKCLMVHMRNEFRRVRSDDYKKKIGQKMDEESKLCKAMMQKKFNNMSEEHGNN